MLLQSYATSTYLHYVIKCQQDQQLYPHECLYIGVYYCFCLLTWAEHEMNTGTLIQDVLVGFIHFIRLSLSTYVYLVTLFYLETCRRHLGEQRHSASVPHAAFTRSDSLLNQPKCHPLSHYRASLRKH